MKITGHYCTSLVVLALLGSASTSWAQEVVSAERAKLVTMVNQVIGDPAKFVTAIAQGRDRVVLCAQCHGLIGSSKMQGVPNLAGQSPAYLLEQVEKFADGRRKNFVMQSLARSFTLQDKVNIAVYYSSQLPDAEKTDSSLANEGARIYQGACQICHGDDGRGEAGYARLAGQRPDYVIMTLKRYRENARQVVSSDDMKRHNVRMEQVTQNLSDEDINALAAYIALLK